VEEESQLRVLHLIMAKKGEPPLTLGKKEKLKGRDRAEATFSSLEE